jgi:thymidylate kinase
MHANRLMEQSRSRPAVRANSDDGRSRGVSHAPRSDPNGPAAPLHPDVRAVFAALDDRSVRWALLRGKVSTATAGEGDIDLLVHPADAQPTQDLFLTLGFVRLPRPGTHFLRYDGCADVWFWFHVVHDLSFAGRRLVTGAAEACLARVAGTPAELAPDDAFWTLLLHCVLDKGRITESHGQRLAVLAGLSAAPGPLSAFMEQLCADKVPQLTAGALREMTARRDWIAVEQAVAALVPFSSGPASLLERLWARARSAIRPFWLHRSHHGLSVALLGPDGAGKSTLAQGLSTTFKLPTRVMYMGLTGGRLRQIAKLRVPGVVFAGRALVIWQRYLRARLHQARGRLVVFDRYTLDAAVPHPNDLGRLQRLSRWLDGHLCPAPDIVIVLDAPGRVMHRRKGEYTAEMLEDWRRHFLALRHRIPRLDVIDATSDADAVRIEATCRIWRRYQTAWGRP